MPHARSGDQPEAMLNVLFRIMEKNSDGGATLQELKEAYSQVKDVEPSDRTIYRLINRINRLFDPLAYDDEDDPETGGGNRLIAYRKPYYVITRDLSAAPRLDSAQAFMMALGVYPQRRNLLASPFEAVMKTVLQYSLSKVAEWQRMQREIEQYVHVSDHVPAKPERNANLVYRVFEGIRRHKRVRLDYRRVRDGSLIKGREVEPYGVLNRHGSWYFVGRSHDGGTVRIYRFDHVQKLSLVENSDYRIPPDFSLKDQYGCAWGTWTEDEPTSPETVVICANPRMAEKFDQIRFHDSQCHHLRPDGTLCITFRVTGAREMVPWILSWGDTVKVEQPAWLAEELAETAKRVAGMYGGSG